MKRSVAGALALFTISMAWILGCGTVRAQNAPPAGPPGPNVCASFPKVSEEAAKRGAAVTAGIKAHVERKQICTLMTSFLAAEGAVVKFLVDNQTWCGVPAEAIKNAKAGHEKSLEFRTRACAEDMGHGKPPSLSDAIKTPTVDSAANTRTGHGTFDSLTGNPLAR
jgi:hypothetical protein